MSEEISFLILANNEAKTIKNEHFDIQNVVFCLYTNEK